MFKKLSAWVWSAESFAKGVGRFYLVVGLPIIAVHGIIYGVCEAVGR